MSPVGYRTHLLIEEFAGFLLYGVDELHLAGREAHQQGDALRCGCDGVEVMTCGLRSFVYPLVYGFTKIGSLDKDKYTQMSMILTLLRKDKQPFCSNSFIFQTLSFKATSNTSQLGAKVYPRVLLQRFLVQEG